MITNYLEQILKARVYDVAIETPPDPAPRLSARLDNRILLKREDLQHGFSFKLRGAYNKLSQLSPAERAAGVSAVRRAIMARASPGPARPLACVSW